MALLYYNLFLVSRWCGELIKGACCPHDERATSDKVKVVTQITTALIVSIFCVAAMEFMLGASMSVYYIHYVLAFCAPFYIVPGSIKIQSLFATNIRMRMFSLSHSIGSLIFSSTTPFICMLFWKWEGSVSLVLAYFLMQLGILFLTIITIEKKGYTSMFEKESSN